MRLNQERPPTIGQAVPIFQICESVLQIKEGLGRPTNPIYYNTKPEKNSVWGPDVIRKEAWPFNRKKSCVRLHWELEKT